MREEQVRGKDVTDAGGDDGAPRLDPARAARQTFARALLRKVWGAVAWRTRAKRLQVAPSTLRICCRRVRFFPDPAHLFRRGDLSDADSEGRYNSAPRHATVGRPETGSILPSEATRRGRGATPRLPLPLRVARSRTATPRTPAA
eukprot:365759-Chlamydomonas_euryale.AAC.8